MAPTRRNDPCDCGSGRKYKHCCGQLAAKPVEDIVGDEPVNVSLFGQDAEYKPSGYLASKIKTDEQFDQLCPDQPPGQSIGAMVLPRGIMARARFADPGLCKTLMEFADRKGGFESMIQDATKTRDSFDDEVTFRSGDRVSTNIDIRDVFDQVLPLVATAYREAESFFGVKVDWFEYPEMLCYSKGGHYLPHADAENWDSSRQCWVRGMDRDLSIIIYLNGEFEGGQLDFPNFGFRLNPQGGMLTCFPADHRYVHAARPVESGIRYVLVSWAATHGSPRVKDRAPHSSFEMSAFEQ